MHVVDTSGWIEHLFAYPNQLFFTPVIDDRAHLLVPTVCLHEVLRIVTRARSRNAASEISVQMKRATVVDLDVRLAELSARLGLRHNLSLADSIIYATAQAHGATLYTQDADMAKLPGVKSPRRRS